MKIRQSDCRIYPARLHFVSEAPSYYAMAHHVGRLPGATWLLIVYILLTFCSNALEARVVSSRTAAGARSGRNDSQPTPVLLNNLASVFGFHQFYSRLRNHAPPDYLRHLYHSTTDSDGVARNPPPYHADTIYGYLDTINARHSGSPNPRNYVYNVSHLEPGSRLLSADFHVFRIRGQRSLRVKRVASRRRSRMLTMKLYKVIEPNRRSSPYGNRLVDVKRIFPNYHGWIIFNAQRAVNEWVRQGHSSNYGFLVTTQTSDGQYIDMSAMALAQRFEHHDRLQPLLAVYTNHTKDHTTEDSSRTDTRLSDAFDSLDPLRYQNVYRMNFYVPTPRSRKRRDVSAVSSGTNFRSRSATGGGPSGKRLRSRSRSRVERHSQAGGRSRAASKRRSQMSYPHLQYCSRRSMYVNFSKVGWDAWIISPPGFNAQICQGQCPFPLGQTYKPTNHAVVQSIVHAMKVVPNVQSPCCVPHKLKSIRMLYYDENYRVILKQYDGMVVSSCGCQ